MMRGWADSGCDSGHGCLRAGRVCVEVTWRFTMSREHPWTRRGFDPGGMLDL
jgi:hypothetical protein